MPNIVARLRVGQRVVRVVACDRTGECKGRLHLHIETVENGEVTSIAQVWGADGEAVARSGRFLRMLAVMVHGEDVESTVLFPDADDEHGVLRGTRPLKA